MTTARKSRFAGVIWDAEKGLWSAHVKLDGYAQHVGYYADDEAAVEAIMVRSAQAHRAMDLHGVDLEMDQRWDMVAGSDFLPDESFLPTAPRKRGVVPGRAARVAASPSDAAGYPAGGVPSF